MANYQAVVESLKASHGKQCDQLHDMVRTNLHARRKLRKALRKLLKAQGVQHDEHHDGLRGLVQKALRIVSQLVFGIDTESSDQRSVVVDEDKTRKILKKLQEKFGVSSIEQLEDTLIHLESHLDTLKDHAEVICSAPKATSSGSLQPDHGPLSAVMSLLKHISQDSSLLPDDATIESRAEVTFVDSLTPDSDAPHVSVAIISGLPGTKEGGVVGDVTAELKAHQVNIFDNQVGHEMMELRLTWRIVAQLADNWYEASVDAQTLQVVGIVDWASSLSPTSNFKKDKRNKGGKQKPLPRPAPAKNPYTYSVFPFGVNDPTVGNITQEHAPWDIEASPAGWHALHDKANPWAELKVPGMKTGAKSPFIDSKSGKNSAFATSGLDKNNTETWSIFATTMGNNVLAQEDWEGASNWLYNDRPVNSSYIFDYEYLEPFGVRPKDYIDFAVTQLFYTSNAYHDLLYRLGFDEISGNFQMDNFGKGGRGGDAVVCQAQDGSGFNNANFMTPPDGQQPRMRMYVWNTATPYRDGDIEAGIVIHEYTHGLSTRLTGGPMNSGCLGYGEAGGMGEGWGDAFATLIRQTHEYDKSKKQEYAMGAWAANRPTGIRNYVYSSNFTSNPSTFKTLDKPGYWGVHAIGEVWAEMLFVLNEKLIAKHGFSKSLVPPANTTETGDEYYHARTFDGKGRPKPLVPKHGNSLLAHLLVDGMKLQPCRPTFVNARDAIIQADTILTGGENTCEIWQAFSERGLGPDARTIGSTPWGGGVRSEDYTVPKVCRTKDKKPKKPRH